MRLPELEGLYAAVRCVARKRRWKVQEGNLTTAFQVSWNLPGFDAQLTSTKQGCGAAAITGFLSQTVLQAEFDSRAYRKKLGLIGVWTCCDYLDTLRERNESGDREKAISLLDESLAISSEPDVHPLMDRVLSRRDILNAQPAAV